MTLHQLQHWRLAKRQSKREGKKEILKCQKAPPQTNHGEFSWKLDTATTRNCAVSIVQANHLLQRCQLQLYNYYTKHTFYITLHLFCQRIWPKQPTVIVFNHYDTMRVNTINKISKLLSAFFLVWLPACAGESCCLLLLKRGDLNLPSMLSPSCISRGRDGDIRPGWLSCPLLNDRIPPYPERQIKRIWRWH